MAIRSEANWRSASGRAYYALIHEGRTMLERWGFPLPPHADIHDFVRQHFNFGAHPDLVSVGQSVNELGRLRNVADYHLGSPGPFVSSARAGQAIHSAQIAIADLDAIEADPARRAAVIAVMRAVWP
jgi:hypothetical protein